MIQGPREDDGRGFPREIPVRNRQIDGRPRGLPHSPREKEETCGEGKQARVFHEDSPGF